MVGDLGRAPSRRAHRLSLRKTADPMHQGDEQSIGLHGHHIYHTPGAISARAARSASGRRCLPGRGRRGTPVPGEATRISWKNRPSDLTVKAAGRNVGLAAAKRLRSSAGLNSTRVRGVRNSAGMATAAQGCQHFFEVAVLRKAAAPAVLLPLVLDQVAAGHDFANVGRDPRRGELGSRAVLRMPPILVVRPQAVHDEPVRSAGRRIAATYRTGAWRSVAATRTSSGDSSRSAPPAGHSRQSSRRRKESRGFVS